MKARIQLKEGPATYTVAGHTFRKGVPEDITDPTLIAAAKSSGQLSVTMLNEGKAADQRIPQVARGDLQPGVRPQRAPQNLPSPESDDPVTRAADIHDPKNTGNDQDGNATDDQLRPRLPDGGGGGDGSGDDEPDPDEDDGGREGDDDSPSSTVPPAQEPQEAPARGSRAPSHAATQPAPAKKGLFGSKSTPPKSKS